jgi:hypothetical protein
MLVIGIILYNLKKLLKPNYKNIRRLLNTRKNNLKKLWVSKGWDFFSCQKPNYQFLPENVIYISYISGIPMLSTPEIDSRKQHLSLEIWE